MQPDEETTVRIDIPTEDFVEELASAEGHGSIDSYITYLADSSSRALSIMGEMDSQEAEVTVPKSLVNEIGEEFIDELDAPDDTGLGVEVDRQRKEEIFSAVMSTFINQIYIASAVETMRQKEAGEQEQ